MRFGAPHGGRLGRAVAGLALAFVAAPVRALVSSDEDSIAAPAQRRDEQIESLLAACETAGAETTVRALLLRAEDAVDWIVRVRLGRTTAAGERNPCALAVELQTLRQREQLARERIQAHMREDSRLPPYAQAMLLVAEFGHGADLTTLVEWAALLDAAAREAVVGVEAAVGDSTQAESAMGSRPEGAAALRRAAARLAAAAAGDRSAWSDAFEIAPDELRFALVRGLADAGGAEAIARLGELIGAGVASDSTLLAELARAGRRIDRAQDEAVLERVRPLLDSDRVDIVRDAALCAGALGDERSIGVLIDLLEHEHAGVRANAQWSLNRLTGRRLGPTAERWRRWLEPEATWWRDEAPAALNRLASADPQVRVGAAHELSRRRYPRHALSAALATHLPVHDPASAAVICATLKQLGSQNGAEILAGRVAEALDKGVRSLLEDASRELQGPAKGDSTLP